MTALWDGTLDPTWLADRIGGMGPSTQVWMGQGTGSTMGWGWPRLKAPSAEDALQPSTLQPVSSQAPTRQRSP